MEKRCDWRLYINKKDKNESYFLLDESIQGECIKGGTIKYVNGGSSVDIELHENLYLAAAFNNHDVKDVINLDTMHGKNCCENFYTKHRNHHASLVVLNNGIFILMQTDDNSPFFTGEVLASKKAIKRVLEDLDTDITMQDDFC